MKQIIPLIILAGLTGCASITGSKNQPLSVQAVYTGKSIEGADCTLTNDKGTWFAKTPGSVVVQKSGQDLVVKCDKEGVPSGSTTVASSANGGAWGNILFGGIIGYAIDAGTGAAFDYPTSLAVQMGQVIKLEPPKQEVDGASQQSQGSAATATAGASSTISAGGLTFDQGPIAANQSPSAQKLRELKTLKDEGVITQKEYDTKKAALIKSM